MKRPVMLPLSLAEAEALILMLAKHKGVWRVIAHELAVDPVEVEERLVESHRAGLALLKQ